MKEITTLKVRAARNLVAQGIPRKRATADLLGIPLYTISQFLDRGNERYNLIDNYK